jgi:hypothetical protein
MADGEYRHCVGVPGLLYEIPQASIKAMPDPDILPWLDFPPCT